MHRNKNNNNNNNMRKEINHTQIYNFESSFGRVGWANKAMQILSEQGIQVTRGQVYACNKVDVGSGVKYKREIQAVIKKLFNDFSEKRLNTLDKINNMRL